MGLEGVADDDALVAADQRLEGGRALVVADPVHHHAGRREAPHLPGLLLVASAQLGPAGLVEADDRLREDMGVERVVDDLDSSGGGVELVPERLRRDDEAVARQDALLARQRNVVEVLVDGDLDREAQRVATAGRGALRARRGLDAAAAAADVLLLLDSNQSVADLDDVDHLRGLELARHRLEPAAAAGTDSVRLIELERLLDDGQLRLRRRARTGARLAVGLLGALDPLEPLLEHGRLARELLDQREGRLQIAGAAAQRLQLAALARQRVGQMLVGDLEREGDAAKLLDVLLALDVGRHLFS